MGSGYTACGKVTAVFGVKVCVTTDAFQKNKSKCEHVVNVFYQLLDNNADGFVDDAAVHNEMVRNNYLLFVPNTETESERDGWPDSVGVAQMTGIFETTPNTCDVPTNRGASATDRATWSNKRDTSNNPNGCSNERDATTEEILHLITAAASAVYPEKWAPTWSSAAGRAVKLANGNCGWGYRGLEGSFVRQVRRTVRLRRQDLRCQLYHRRGDLLGIRFLHRRTVHEGTSYRCST